MQTCYMACRTTNVSIYNSFKIQEKQYQVNNSIPTIKTFSVNMLVINILILSNIHYRSVLISFCEFQNCKNTIPEQKRAQRKDVWINMIVNKATLAKCKHSFLTPMRNTLRKLAAMHAIDQMQMSTIVSKFKVVWKVRFWAKWTDLSTQTLNADPRRFLQENHYFSK